jgi:hypothetical protein
MKFLATLQIEIEKPKSSIDDICGFIFSELNDFNSFLPEGNFVSIYSIEVQETDQFE